MKILETQNLTKVIDHKKIVNGINMQVNKGQLVSLLGLNGAGKSTTLKMLTGINYSTFGTVKIMGMTPENNNYSHQIGVVFQNSILDKELSVKNNLFIRARMYKNIDKKYVDSLIEELGLQSILHQKYKNLSGGQRRKVDIIRALLHKPKILFLDEPSTGLDIQSRNKIWSFIKSLKQKYNLTIILTTHYLEETERSDYVYIMDEGKFIASDSVENLKIKYSKNILALTFNINFDAKQYFIDHDIKYAYEHNKYLISFNNDKLAINFITEMQNYIDSFEYKHGTMDDVFLNLTGKKANLHD
ncbi:ABC transporter ATP-binding protein [Apilactobacillus xinyiensis]|uniref:ABC transporter ATP-binding protein n=1 Tax=Apilactobacillus xinyiensis TaxID=2841032 RepID=UPI00200E77CE|nr:ABC transporter ATP-binding protein [Apilactobacillus xinyiensis]MCL0330225.1 ABC transporter ATP-binding protein [Apilactobacillus xinyiensis]